MILKINMTHNRKSKRMKHLSNRNHISSKSISEPVPKISSILPQDVFDPLIDILVEMIISKVHNEKEEKPINVSDLEAMIHNVEKEDVSINACELEALMFKQNIVNKDDSDSNKETILNTEEINNIEDINNREKDDLSIFPYPMTNEFIRKIMKTDYPKMPEYKLNRLMKEYERMDKSDWLEGEILFPEVKNLPKNFWTFNNSLFPMTNDYIQNIIVEYYPEIPQHKLNRLMREFDKIDKSKWDYGEIVFPTENKLPKDFWNFAKS
jgi:hypothetical protein